jgi:hypothetical protein
MKRLLPGLFAATLLALVAGPSPADDKDTTAILDKAIKALGGQDKLSKARALSWKAKGTLTIMDNEIKFNSKVTVQGLDQRRSEFEGDFMGNQIKGVTVVNGKKGWRKIAGMDMEMDEKALANEKRSIYLQVSPITILPLKGKGFKVESAGEEKVGGKAAVVLKVTGPDGKDFKISFDKESGLPVKLVARVAAFGNQQFDQETIFSGYKDFGGIKVATKVENKRDGETFGKQEISDFKAQAKVDDKTFAEPE